MTCCVTCDKLIIAKNSSTKELLCYTKKTGRCGAIYTQISDVEDETNGLLTYDRRVLKVTPERMLQIAKMLKI
ncbi:MAG: hypothetical protein IKA43_05020 [Clostridia bacterium]|nr:hypothetical protein [Clostridia bacterium]